MNILVKCVIAVVLKKKNNNPALIAKRLNVFQIILGFFEVSLSDLYPSINGRATPLVPNRIFSSSRDEVVTALAFKRLELRWHQ